MRGAPVLLQEATPVVPPQPTPCPSAASPAPQLFYRFHIACFLGFFLFTCAHYAPCWYYFAPGACKGRAGGAPGDSPAGTLGYSTCPAVAPPAHCLRPPPPLLL